MELGIARRVLAQSSSEFLLAAFEGMYLSMQRLGRFLMFGGSVQFGELGIGVSALGIEGLLLHQ